MNPPIEPQLAAGTYQDRMSEAVAVDAVKDAVRMLNLALHTWRDLGPNHTWEVSGGIGSGRVFVTLRRVRTETIVIPEA